MGMYPFVFSYLTHNSVHADNITSLFWNEDSGAHIYGLKLSSMILLSTNFAVQLFVYNGQELYVVAH